MAQHAQLWALPVAKRMGQSKIACNITLGKLIGLHHIQSLSLYNKICGLQTSKHLFLLPSALAEAVRQRALFLLLLLLVISLLLLHFVAPRETKTNRSTEGSVI